MKDDFLFNTEPFTDKSMIQLTTQVNTEMENEVLKAIMKVAVDVDKEKLVKWLERASMLDKIEESELIDIAVRKRINSLLQKNEELMKEIEVLEKALELFAENTALCAEDLTPYEIHDKCKYYIEEAKKQLEEK